MRTESRWIVRGALVALLVGVCRARDAEPPKAPPEETPKPAAVEDEANEIPLEKLPETEPPGARKIGTFYVEGGVWFARPSGLGFRPAIAYEDSVNAIALDMTFKSETPPLWRFGWEIPNDMGELRGAYFGYSQEQAMSAALPGQYVYGEIEAFPLFAGVFDDGLSDGFAAQASTLLRETRIDYARKLFDGPRAHGKWFAGVRMLTQKWQLNTQYYSLVQPPELYPPILPPRTDLLPLPDLAHSSSEYSGRGLEAGLDLKFPIDRAGKFSVEAGFAVAALRGKVRSESFAQNHYYLLTFEGVETILAAPYDIFTAILVPDGGQPIDAITFITQETVAIGLKGNSLSQSALAVDAYLGFRWKIWHELEVFAGLRDQRYVDAGEIVRPASAVVQPNGSVNVQSVSRTSLSTMYEGFYLGVGFLF